MAKSAGELWLEERKKKQQEGSTTPQSSSGSSRSAGDEWLYARRQSKAQSVAQEIQNRLNGWGSSLQGLYDDYSSRYEGDTGAYRAYRSDYSEWLDSVNKHTSTFDDDYNYINSALKEYGDYLDPEWVSNIQNYVKESNQGIRGIKSAAQQDYDIFSQFEDETAYKKYVTGWLNTEGETNADSVAGRTEIYNANAARIKEIDSQLKEINESYANADAWGAHSAIVEPDYQIEATKQKGALQKEKEQLEAENRQYERMQKTTDGYYSITQSDNFAVDSQQRNYTNATKDELAQYQTRMDGGWTQDAENNLYDIYGEKWDETYYDRVKQPEVSDKLGLFLGTTEDDIEQAYAAGTTSDRIWAQYIIEGDSNSWNELAEDEIGIYYTLYKNEGQEAAYKFLDDMTVELNRRAAYGNIEAIKKEYDEAGKAKRFGMNLMTFPTQLVGGASAAISDLGYTLRGETINPYDSAHYFQDYASTIRGETSENWNEATGNKAVLGIKAGDVYQAGMSAGDSALGSLIGGTAYGVLMGTGAASAKTRELYEKGASDGQIVTGSILAGAAEMIFEKISIDKFINLKDPKTKLQIVKNALIQGGVEASEEAATEIANTITDAIVMGSRSDFSMNVDAYMASGKSYSEAVGSAIADVAINTWKAAASGFISGGTMGGAGGTYQYRKYNRNMDTSGKGILRDGNIDAIKQAANILTGDTTVAVSEKNKKAVNSILSKLSKNYNAKNVGKLADWLSDAVSSQNIEDISKALQEKGLSKKEADIAAEYLNSDSETEDIKLSDKQIEAILGIAEDVTLNPESIVNKRSDVLEAALEGKAINAEEYSRLLKEAETATEAQTSENEQVIAEEVKTALAGENGEILKDNQPSAAVNAPEAETSPANVLNDEVYEAEDEPETDTTRVENYAEKYGAQAAAYVRNYNVGQDVDAYDMGFDYAYNKGKAGAPFEDVVAAMRKSSVLRQLTDAQIDIAYSAGADVANEEAITKDKANKEGANGKTGRKKGVVKGRDVSIDELKTAFNDRQNVAYKLLSWYADVTGIDIELYKDDSVNAEGVFTGAQGKFVRSGDGSVIYINVSAGLYNESDVNTLAKYTMVQTFSHEFLHFIEKWNPIEYNGFRRFVFEKLSEKHKAAPENNPSVSDLIDTYMAADGLSHEDASREVIANAMTDILDDSNIMQELAEEHPNVFKQLLEKLKEFVQQLRDYFKGSVKNPYYEAKALKEEVNGALKYFDDVIERFDKLAKNAVNNYQANFAVDEVTEETKVEETAKAEPKTDTSEHGFTVTDNTEYGTLEISFESKPSEAIRNVLKENKFRWHGKKGVWYGKGDRANIIDALNTAYAANVSEVVKNVEERAEQKEKLTGRETKEQRTGTQKEDGNGREIQGRLQQSERGDGPLYRSFWERRRELSKTKKRFPEDSFIAPQEGTVEAEEYGKLAEYGIEGYVVKKSAWNGKAEALSNAGRIYMQEGLAENCRGIVVPHEATHIMKQMRFPLYLDFIERTPDMMNIPTERGQKLLEQAAGHRNVDIFDMTEEQRTGLYDEINAMIYGHYAAGQLVGKNRDMIASAFNDFDSYIEELANIHNMFKEINRNGENVDNQGAVQPVVGNGQGNAQLLDGLETEDVQGVSEGRDTLRDTSDTGRQSGRNDNRPDAERVSGGPSEGDSESRVSDGNRGDGGTGRAGRDGREVADSLGDNAGTERTEEYADRGRGRIEPESEPTTIHDVVSEQIEQKSTEQPKGSNFVIGESLDLPSGEKARYKANVEAIRLIKKLEAEGRYATATEQAILSKYVGWGGLANAFDERKGDWAKEYAELKELLTDEEYTLARGSTLNAHYTDISVIKAMYDGLKQLGFTGGRMLEPSSGTGNFVGAMPTDMSTGVKSWTMVELDSITGRIAKYLYPNADVRIQGFEKANIPDNYMDVAISNVPFGNYAIADKKYPKKVTSAIHNYFFAKTLDKVRPGGIVMFITSSFTMNSKDSAVRKYIMQRADLLGAIRLPDTAFKGNAGTEVVTDIIVLKKRADNTNYEGESFETADYQNISGYNGAYINNYFTEHPEMVLGTPEMTGGMYRGGNLTYKAFTDRGPLADQIRKAFESIQGKMEYPFKPTPEKTNFAVEKATKKAKNDNYVVKEGKVYKYQEGDLVEQTVSAKAAEKIKGLLDIRDAHRELATALQQGQNENSVKAARKALNKAYDDFVKKHGYINARGNKNVLKGDPDMFSILALENYDETEKVGTKADIFTKNTIAPNRTVTHAETVEEALIVSRNETGGVDVPRIAQLTGKTEEDVTRELIDTRLAFKNRYSELEAAEVYLSGNVRAKLRDAEMLIPFDEDYKHNVEALKKVIPEDVPYQDIFCNPGTPWIPDTVYSDFAAYMLNTFNYERNKAVEITRHSETGAYVVELKNNYLKDSSFNKQKWGVGKNTFIKIFDAMLNSRSIVVKYKTDDGKSVVDKDATAAVNEKIENITKEFQDWLWRDETRRTELATLYNETFNSIVTPKYNGDNLTVNGSNAIKPLRPHQRDAVQRVISSGGNTLLAHKVGAGKTYEMAAAAMKLKQLGIIKKPMFVVPKTVAAQWGNEFMDYFPTARILVTDAKDFSAKNRKIYTNRIATGSWDAVIVTYEQFEKLPMSSEYELKFYEAEISNIIAAIEVAKEEKGAKPSSIKDLEKKKKSLQTKIDKLTDIKKDENNIEFEQLGVDSIFVDEAHNFKNLFYTTSMTNVSGLGNKDGAQRSYDLYMKVRYLQQLNGGRGVVFATATPVMNSMAEMYIMQKYLQPDVLEQLGLTSFDAWAKQFGEVVNGVEIKPSGQGYRVKQSFSRFKNMSELQLLFRNFADVLTDIPGLKIPKMKGGKVNVVVCEPGQFQKDYMNELEKRADNIKNVDPSVDNMLKITSDGRKISYTQRMIDPTLPYEEGCKLYRCADNIIEEYKNSKDIKGTQIVFMDMATPKASSKNTGETEETEMDMESAKLYDDLKARLVKSGIPAKEIAFIHDADTDPKKETLFKNVNEGKVRVLIGSTGKMGVGMNAQKRVVAIHHLDAPWRPGDVEQRNGRAFRQGNINDEVSCYTYVTEGSFDARLWDILDRKSQFINQVMNGENVGRETEDTGEVTLSAAEVKALASGSPLILEQVQLETDIKKLESLRRAHLSAIIAAKEKLAKDETLVAEYTKRIADGKVDVASIVDTYSDKKFSLTVGKKAITDKKLAGIALMAEAQAKATEDGYTTIGKFAGFDLRVVKTHEGIKGLVSGKSAYSFKLYPDNTTYMITQLTAVIEGLEGNIDLMSKALEATKADMIEQQKLINEPFTKQADLDAKRSRYNEIMAILNPKEEQSLDNIAEEDVQNQARKRTDDNDEYPTDGVHWGMGMGAMNRAEARAVWEAIANINKLGYIYPKTIRGEHIISTDYALFFVNANYRYPSVNTIIRFDEKYKLSSEQAKELIINAEGDKTRHREALRIIEIAYGQGYVSQYDIKNGLTYGGEIGTGEGSNSRTDIDGYRIGENSTSLTDDQNQERRKTYTDREVLAYAAERLDNMVNLDDAQRDALKILKKRLDRLEEIEIRRKELGQQYKEQQFGANVDREQAAETLKMLNEHKVMLEQAENEVLSATETEVLKRTLKEARKFVESEERKAGYDILRAYRERRDETAAVKKYRAKVKTLVDTLSKWLSHPSNKDALQHIPDALKSTVIPFIASIDFSSKRKLAGGAATQADQAFIKQLEDLKRALNPHFDVENAYSEYIDLRPDFIEKLETYIDIVKSIVENSGGDTFVVNKMNSEELKALASILSNLKQAIVTTNRFHSETMFENISTAAKSSMASMDELGEAKTTGMRENYLMWKQMRPSHIFARFGAGGKAIEYALRKGQATLAFNTKKIIDFANATYTAEQVKNWAKEIKTLELSCGTVKMPATYAMYLYKLSERPEAYKHMLSREVRISKWEQKTQSKKIQLTESDIKAIIKSLSQEQRDVADKLQRFMATVGAEWGNYVSLRRFGEAIFKDDRYMTIRVAKEEHDAKTDTPPEGSSLYALLNKSFTKEINEYAENIIDITDIFDVFAAHMSDMAQYNAFALPILDTLKWLNYKEHSYVEMTDKPLNWEKDYKKYYAKKDDGVYYKVSKSKAPEWDSDTYYKKVVSKSVRSGMAKAFGLHLKKTKGNKTEINMAERFVKNIIQEYSGTSAHGTPADAAGTGALHRYNVSRVAYNARVAIQQPTAITRAGSVIDYKSIVKGMKLPPAEIKSNIEEMQKYSGIAVWKSLGFYDINISRGVTQLIKHDENRIDKFNGTGMWLAEKLDMMTWGAIWSACKEEIARKHKLTPSDSGYYEAVTALFEDVIYKTQVVDSVLSKNEWMRDKGFWARSTSSFMNESVTSINGFLNVYDEMRMEKRKGADKSVVWQKYGKKLVREIEVYAIQAIVQAAFASIIDAFKDDDEYEEFWEKYLESFGENFWEALNPFSKIPLIADAAEIIISIVSSFMGDTYSNTPNSFYGQIADDIIDATTILAEKLGNDDTNYTWYGFVYKLISAASGAFGIGGSPLMREAATIWNHTVGELAPSMKATTYKAGAVNNIKYALADGWLTQDEAIAYLEATGEDVESEVKKILRDNDTRILETAIELYNGNSTSMERVVNAIVREGGHDKKLVIEAIRAEESYFKSQITKAANASIDGEDKDYEKIVNTLVNRYGSISSLNEIEAAIEKKIADILDEEPEVDGEVSYYRTSDINGALENGNTSHALDIIEEIVETKIANGTEKDKAYSSILSSVTSYWKPLYLEAYAAGDTKEMARIRTLLNKTKLYDNVYKSCNKWIRDSKK